jgi:hypothetical protein
MPKSNNGINISLPNLIETNSDKIIAKKAINAIVMGNLSQINVSFEGNR